MSDLSKAAVNRAHVLVITARSHAVEAHRSVEQSKGWCEAWAALDTIAKQLELIEDVLCQNEGPLEDEEPVSNVVPIRKVAPADAEPEHAQ